MNNTKDPEINAQFQRYFEQQLQNVDDQSPNNLWNNMKSAMYDAAAKAFKTG